MQEGLTFLGIRLHNFGLVYLMECFPCVVILNQGMANSLFLSEYLVFVIWKRSTKYFGQFLFFVLSAVCIRHQTVLQTHFSII